MCLLLWAYVLIVLAATLLMRANPRWHGESKPLAGNDKQHSHAYVFNE